MIVKDYRVSSLAGFFVILLRIYFYNNKQLEHKVATMCFLLQFNFYPKDFVIKEIRNMT